MQRIHRLCLKPRFFFKIFGQYLRVPGLVQVVDDIIILEEAGRPYALVLVIDEVGGVVVDAEEVEGAGDLLFLLRGEGGQAGGGVALGFALGVNLRKNGIVLQYIR